MSPNDFWFSGDISPIVILTFLGFVGFLSFLPVGDSQQSKHDSNFYERKITGSYS
jgi:hypothetical protein